MSTYALIFDIEIAHEKELLGVAAAITMTTQVQFSTLQCWTTLSIATISPSGSQGAVRRGGYFCQALTDLLSSLWTWRPLHQLLRA